MSHALFFIANSAVMRKILGEPANRPQLKSHESDQQPTNSSGTVDEEMPWSEALDQSPTWARWDGLRCHLCSPRGEVCIVGLPHAHG